MEEDYGPPKISESQRFCVLPFMSGKCMTLLPSAALASKVTGLATREEGASNVA